MMSSGFDQKELKVLSDILALVLEEQPGQSEAALQALRNRARKNAMTGGALKNLFTAIAPNPPERNSGAAAKPRAPRSTSTAKTAAANAETQKARLQVRELTESINRLDKELRTVRALNSDLRAELFATQQARAETQTQLLSERSGLKIRNLIIILCLTVGIVLGIAGTELFHTLFATTAPPPKSIFLY